MKKKILIIADRPNWAYHNIQKFIFLNFKNKYEIYTDFLSFNLKNKKQLCFLKLLKNKVKQYYLKLKYQKVSKNNKYDLVIFLGFYFPKKMKINFTTKYTIVGIYTDGFPPAGCNQNIKTPEEFIKHYLSNVNGIICGSDSIKEFYKNYFKNIFHANGALDEKLFFNKNNFSSKYSNTHEAFKIGWTGNPNREFKHFYDIIIPAVEKAKQIRPNIEFYTKFKGSLKSLANFYKDLDIVLIASDKDAGPSLFVEAAYMNVPSISNKIGKPSEVIIDGENGLFVDNNIDAFTNAVIYLYDNRELLNNMKRRIRQDTINTIGKEAMINKWEKVFNYYFS